MEVSSARLNGIRAVLVVGLILALFWGIGQLFFPQSILYVMIFVAKEAPVIGSVTSALFIILLVALLALYPWRQTQT